MSRSNSLSLLSKKLQGQGEQIGSLTCNWSPLFTLHLHGVLVCMEYGVSMDRY